MMMKAKTMTNIVVAQMKNMLSLRVLILPKSIDIKEADAGRI